MRIMRLKSHVVAQSSDNGVLEKSLLSTPDGRVSYLKYRIDVESRLGDGAKKIMMARPDRKAYSAVSSECTPPTLYSLPLSPFRLRRV